MGGAWISLDNNARIPHRMEWVSWRPIPHLARRLRIQPLWRTARDGGVLHRLQTALDSPHQKLRGRQVFRAANLNELCVLPFL